MYWLGCGLDLRNRGSTRGIGKIVTSSLNRLVLLWGLRSPFSLVVEARRREVKRPTMRFVAHPEIMPRTVVCGAMPLLSHMPSCIHNDNLTFTLSFSNVLSTIWNTSVMWWFTFASCVLDFAPVIFQNLLFVLIQLIFFQANTGVIILLHVFRGGYVYILSLFCRITWFVKLRQIDVGL